ncbi:MAG: ribosome maturation factor RimP [Elusimicrobia bacterium]|nr:ribosome maturation factor RimP [Elusimicrobiota bacterium]
MLELEWRPGPNGWTLQLVLDHDTKPITLSDCEEVSRRVEAHLDQSGLIERHYSLEVSSPGLRRVLRKEKDYHRFLGERAKIELKNPFPGTNQRVFRGTLEAVAEGFVLLVDDDNQRRWSLALSEIAKANLDPEINV